MPETKKRRENDSGIIPIKRIGLCSVIGASLYFFELILFSFAELKMAFGNGFYLPVGLAAAVISSFAAGFAAVCKHKKNALASGALTGAIEAIISDIILAIVNEGNVGKGLILVVVASVIGGAIGGVVAANIKQKIKY